MYSANPRRYRVERRVYCKQKVSQVEYQRYMNIKGLLRSETQYEPSMIQVLKMIFREPGIHDKPMGRTRMIPLWYHVSCRDPTEPLARSALCYPDTIAKRFHPCQ